MESFFYFGRREYSVTSSIIPGSTTLIILHEDLDNTVLNYHVYHKIIRLLKGEYSEPVEMARSLSFVVFPKYSFLSKAQLWSIDQNFVLPLVQKRMKIIGLEKIPDDTRLELQRQVKNCRVCQYNEDRPRKFLFSVTYPIIGEFNQVLQIEIMSLRHRNILGVTDVSTGFHSGGVFNKINENSTWKGLCLF